MKLHLSRMKHYLILIIFLVTISSCIEEHEAANGRYEHDLRAKVIYLKDGDSFIVLDENKEKIEVRLLDIDAPELHQAFGKKSKQYLSKLIKGKQIGLDYDKKDKYGRLLAYAYLDSLNLNEEMIRLGYAWHFTRFSEDKELQELEDYAREFKLGLWHDPNPQEPWVWRKKH